MVEARVGTSETYVYVDGHVHLYPEYDIRAFFRRGLEFARAVEGPLLLLLAESHGCEYFRELRDGDGSGEISSSDFSVLGTSESSSLCVRSENHGDPPVFILSGRQLLSNERIEVLLVGVEPGHPLCSIGPGELSAEELIGRGLDAGAITVLPWGFGKWLGDRGRRVRRLAERADFRRSPLFFLGDVSARCRPWPAPRAFKGPVRVLPGTDILPLRGFEHRLARYGFRIRGRLDPRAPQSFLVQRFREGDPCETFGTRDTLFRTLVNQMRYRMRRRGRRGST